MFRLHESPSGHVIYVGKNAKANDELIKQSHPDDLWFHAYNVAGSHVVLQQIADLEPTNEDIAYAANLAVQYSKGNTRKASMCTIKDLIKCKNPGEVLLKKEKIIKI